MEADEPELAEEDAYPAMPDNEYGWEKLYAERMAMAYGRRYGMAVRLARFQNCYGPEGTWRGGREKAPAALCRKIAEAEDGGTIEVWGDGTAMRAYTYIDDMIEGILRLMRSGPRERRQYRPPGICFRGRPGPRPSSRSPAKKSISSMSKGPVGVKARNFSNDRISSIGWKSEYLLEGRHCPDLSLDQGPGRGRQEKISENRRLGLSRSSPPPTSARPPPIGTARPPQEPGTHPRRANSWSLPTPEESGSGAAEARSSACSRCSARSIGPEPSTDL